MFNKAVLAVTLFTLNATLCFAGNSFYIAPTVTYVGYSSHNADYAGLNPALYVGYGAWARDWLYFAGEVFATSGSIDISKNHGNNNTLKNEYNYGISLVPLVNLDDVLFGYLRAGYIVTKFNDVSETKGAYQIGAGVESNLFPCWDWRLEYVYTPYGSMNPIGSVRSNEISLALVYRFEPLIGKDFNDYT